MRLPAFRNLKNWSLDDVADALRGTGDCTFRTVRGSLIARHERGMCFPTPEFVRGYEEITEGAVTYQDWVATRDEARALPGRKLPPRPVGRRKKIEA